MTWTSYGPATVDEVLDVLGAVVGAATGSVPDAGLEGVEPEPGSGVDPLPLLGPDGDDGEDGDDGGEDEPSDPANCPVAEAGDALMRSGPPAITIDTARVMGTPKADLMGAH